MRKARWIVLLLPLLIGGCSKDTEQILHQQVRDYNVAVKDLDKLAAAGAPESDLAKAAVLEERIKTMLDEIQRNPKFAKLYKLGRPSASIKGNVQFIEPLE